jgi:hypothetical protein
VASGVLFVGPVAGGVGDAAMLEPVEPKALFDRDDVLADGHGHHALSTAGGVAAQVKVSKGVALR